MTIKSKSKVLTEYMEKEGHPITKFFDFCKKGISINEQRTLVSHICANKLATLTDQVAIHSHSENGFYNYNDTNHRETALMLVERYGDFNYSTAVGAKLLMTEIVVEADTLITFQNNLLSGRFNKTQWMSVLNLIGVNRYVGVFDLALMHEMVSRVFDDEVINKDTIRENLKDQYNY